MAEEETLKPTREETASNLLRLGKCLHDFAFPPGDGCIISRPHRSHEAERLKAEISRLRSLQDKKSREAAGLYVVENPKVVVELLATGHRFVELYATADVVLPPGAPTPVTVTPAELLRISHFPTPSPVFAVGRIERDPADGSCGTSRSSALLQCKRE